MIKLDGNKCWVGNIQTDRTSMHWIEIMPSGVHPGYYHLGYSLLRTHQKITTKHAVPPHGVEGTIDHWLKDYNLTAEDIKGWQETPRDKLIMLAEYVRNEPRVPKMEPVDPPKGESKWAKED